MADAINELIERLANIDEAAGKMVAAAEEEKKVIGKEHSDKIAGFNKKLDEEYEEKLEKKSEELARQSSDKIEKLRNEMKNTVEKLEEDYRIKKDEWVGGIFNSIIGE